MRLVIEGFKKGLIDSNVITRMGLARPQAGSNEQELVLPDCPATDINAIEFYPKLTISKMDGREKLHESPWQNSAIIRLYQWQNETGVEFALAFSCVSGATSAAIAMISKATGTMVFTPVSVSGDALSEWAPTCSGDMIDAVAYGGSAVMTYGGPNMPLAVFTGGDFIAPLLGTNNPSGAKTVAAWGSYLFVGNMLVGAERSRSRVQWCESLNPSNWPAYNFIELDSMDGDEITAMWLLKDVLVVFKKYKTFVIKYVGGVLEFDWERIDAGVGCVGPNAITEVDGILYFVSPSGFYAFDGARPPYSLDDTIGSLVKNTNAEIESTFEADYYDDSDQILFTVADGSSFKKNRIYLYDATIRNWTKWDVEVAGIGNILYGVTTRYIDLPSTYESYSLRISDAKGSKDGITTLGTYDGYLHQFGVTANDLGNPLDSYWVSPWIDFGFPDRNKRILRVYVYVEGYEEAYPITFTGYTDWNDMAPKITKTFTTQAIDKDIAEKRLDFTLPCRSFKFMVNVNELNASLTLHKIIIDFLVKGRTVTS